MEGSETATTIPETVFMMFQMTFAVITPGLIAGAFADRMKFSAMMLFIGLWSIIVYAPVAMALADSRIAEAPRLIQTVLYCILGIAWVFPLMPLIRWMERPDEDGAR